MLVSLAQIVRRQDGVQHPDQLLKVHRKIVSISIYGYLPAPSQEQSYLSWYGSTAVPSLGVAAHLRVIQEIILPNKESS